MKTLTVMRCPVHSDFWGICIDDEMTGIRLTPSKCCGQWATVKKWNITETLADEAIRAFEEAKEEALTPAPAADGD